MLIKQSVATAVKTAKRLSQGLSVEGVIISHQGSETGELLPFPRGQQRPGWKNNLEQGLWSRRDFYREFRRRASLDLNLLGHTLAFGGMGFDVKRLDRVFAVGNV